MLSKPSSERELLLTMADSRAVSEGQHDPGMVDRTAYGSDRDAFFHRMSRGEEENEPPSWVCWRREGCMFLVSKSVNVDSPW